MSVLLRFFRRIRSRSFRYEPLKDCTEDEMENRKPITGISLSSEQKCFDDVEEERQALFRALSCERRFVRRNGICEKEIQEDIRTLKQTMFEQAMKMANLM